MHVMFASSHSAHTVPRRLQLQRVDHGHPDRAEIETFIAAVYRERYGAELRSFLPHLIAFRDEARVLHAAVGVRINALLPGVIDRNLKTQLPVVRRHAAVTATQATPASSPTASHSVSHSAPHSASTVLVEVPHETALP